MIELSGLDVRCAVRELSQMQGAKIEKIVQGEEKRDLLFSLYLRDFPKTHLRFLLPGLICTHAEKPGSYPKTPPGFAMFLRKYLQGARITSVEQRGFDRLVFFTIERKDTKLTLAVEMIQPGNMLVLDGGKIKGLLETQNFRDRTLRGGIEYVPPYASNDVSALSEEELVRLMTESDKNSIVTTLALHVGLGGVYAEEACARAQIDKQRNDLTQDELKKVAICIRGMIDEKIAPHADGERAYPFRMESRKVEPRDGTFLAALSAFVESAPSASQDTKRKKTKDKLQTMLAAQEKQIAKLEKQATENARVGERIYEEYLLVQSILQTVQEAREKKQDVNAALKKFPQVKQYTQKTGEIEVELE